MMDWNAFENADIKTKKLLLRVITQLIEEEEKQEMIALTLKKLEIMKK